MADNPTPDKGESIIGIADAIADKLDLTRIERPVPIEERPARMRRRDLWPPEVWAEMGRIWRGEAR